MQELTDKGTIVKLSGSSIQEAMEWLLLGFTPKKFGYEKAFI